MTIDDFVDRAILRGLQEPANINHFVRIHVTLKTLPGRGLRDLKRRLNDSLGCPIAASNSGFPTHRRTVDYHTVQPAVFFAGELFLSQGRGLDCAELLSPYRRAEQKALEEVNADRL